MSIRCKLMDIGYGARRIQVFLNEVRIQSHRTLEEQGVVDGSLLTVRWLWSGEQRKKTNCLTHKERKEEMEKRVRELAKEELRKREAEEELAEEELASLGSTLRKDRRNRTRSSSEGQSDRDATIITGIMCVIYWNG